MINLKSFGICLFAATILTGCEQPNSPSKPLAATENPAAAAPGTSPAAAMSKMTNAATAHVLMMSAADSAVSGKLTATQTVDGVHFVGRIEGLTANSEHGFHVHEVGDCSAPDFSSAGGHFNPMDMAHGNPSSPPHHAGDLPNLRADAQGSADIDFTVAGLTLGDGETTDINGRALVAHMLPDDYTSQPAGASGARIACGVIAEN